MYVHQAYGTPPPPHILFFFLPMSACICTCIPCTLTLSCLLTNSYVNYIYVVEIKLRCLKSISNNSYLNLSNYMSILCHSVSHGLLASELCTHTLHFSHQKIITTINECKGEWWPFSNKCSQLREMKCMFFII